MGLSYLHTVWQTITKIYSFAFFFTLDNSWMKRNMKINKIYIQFFLLEISLFLLMHMKNVIHFRFVYTNYSSRCWWIIYLFSIFKLISFADIYSSTVISVLYIHTRTQTNWFDFIYFATFILYSQYLKLVF